LLFLSQSFEQNLRFFHTSPIAFFQRLYLIHQLVSHLQVDNLDQSINHDAFCALLNGLGNVERQGCPAVALLNETILCETSKGDSLHPGLELLVGVGDYAGGVEGLLQL